MFELPDAKRVRREEVFTSDHESDSEITPGVADESTRAKLNERLSSLLSLNINLPPPVQEDTPMGDAEVNEKEEEEEFAFRLFSTSTPSAAVVLVKKEEEIPSDGREIPFKPRPLDYYIRPELSPEQKAQFEYSAVTAEDVKTIAQQRAWGLEVPWRVTKISVVTSTPKPGSGEVRADGEGKKKKTRPGKKKRIVLRIEAKKKKEEEEKRRQKKEQKKAALATDAEKEEALKAKKARLNRERKLKRRQKAREEKAARIAANGGVDDGKGGGSDSDSE
ncbi:hypothetical protein QBC35DRAFT_165784 [Podospora australis]|uniref:Uncharacterized protein n=1 Tax=Podospora australis TaxID=1536484 RepID=A0AAN6X3V3_9PEZI|nr:hypothetical protein QBC35DRAFT_165784 [Podospora australis]